jgi:hypothetical protein
MTKVLSKPVDVEALSEVFKESGIKSGFSTRSASDGDSIIVEADVSEEVLQMAIASARNRKPRVQVDRELRATLLAKSSWSQQEKDQVLRLLLERAAI